MDITTYRKMWMDPTSSIFIQLEDYLWSTVQDLSTIANYEMLIPLATCRDFLVECVKMYVARQDDECYACGKEEFDSCGTFDALLASNVFNDAIGRLESDKSTKDRIAVFIGNR